MSEQTHDPEVVLALCASGPTELEEAVAGLTEAELDMSLNTANWTIRQIVHPVVDGDDIWETFVKIALGTNEAVFSLQWYWDVPQTQWAERWAYVQREIGPSLELFAANRRHIVQLVRAAADTWNRSIAVKWPKHGEERVTVGWVIEMQADHLTSHVNSIRKIRQAHGL